ncbi:MAG: hypothetical protein ACK2UO_09320, partial [Caldilineaceae bacterium]
LAFLPLLLLWSTPLAHVSSWTGWTPGSARVLFAAMLAVALLLWATDLRRRRRFIAAALCRQETWLALFVSLLLLAIFTRWLQVRALVLPNWVDSVHHVMIARLIVQTGALPLSYEPYIANSVFSYHWGFHSLVAWVAWIYGLSTPFQIASLTLVLGQVINVLMLWALYAAGRVLFASRRAGFLAAALGMFVSWMPAYYAAWGRYPHLTGMAVAVTLLAGLWRLAETRSASWGWWGVVVLSAAGVSLIHVRVAVFTALFAVLLLVWIAISRMRTSKDRVSVLTVLARWMTAALAAVLLIAPWLLRLSTHPRVSETIIRQTSEKVAWSEALNRIPWRQVWVPGMRPITALATGGVSEFLLRHEATKWALWGSGTLLVLLLLIAILNRRRRKGHVPFPWAGLILVYAWTACLLLLVNSDIAGIPTLGFVSVSAAAITFFAPASLSASGIVTWASGVVIPLRWLRPAAVIMTMAIALWGAAHMRDIVNPSTVLVDAQDLSALNWVCENTPSDARFAVDTWLWQGTTYAGDDAGYWISVLCDRQTIVPPVIYALTASRADVVRLNSELSEWTAIQSQSNEAIVTYLRSHAISHLFVGRHARHLDPAKLASSLDLELLYNSDSAYVFGLRSTETSQHASP